MTMTIYSSPCRFVSYLHFYLNRSSFLKLERNVSFIVIVVIVVVGVCTFHFKCKLKHEGKAHSRKDKSVILLSICIIIDTDVLPPLTICKDASILYIQKEIHSISILSLEMVC